ncbi:hypothetical protein [Sediminibacterium ginsengisoli]|uniref:Uncharacterized protein n=1 Tax=Sediminibacterium ginsengisoli TaxID=413434 RepID=A0A1T4QGU6_9BACT|nr:hypothetical protein [Sediminibacterium ginsengisoli]SKA03030.1 hypothetical protein SAMN04488132_108128 [Sediminibacterium ginsengisoli]
MKTKVLILAAITLLILSCNKDTYNTRPKLTFKEVNGNVFGNAQAVIFTLEFTDKEGDVQDSLWVQKVSRTNGCNNFGDRIKIPAYTSTSNLKGIFEVGYSTSVIPNSNYTILPKCSKDDTCYFKFWVRDNGKNVSDTVVSPDIVILK